MALKPLKPALAGGKLKVAAPTAPIDTTWRLRWLLAAPHRVAFLAGALMLALSALWWCIQLVARATHTDMAWTLAPNTAHALLMTLGFMPLFFIGFLFTAGPKWLSRPEVSAQSLVPAIASTVLGWVVCLAGFHLSSGLASAGMALVAAAWTQITWRFFSLWWSSRADDKVHATVVVCANAWGMVAMWLAVWGLAAGHDNLVRAATQTALWIFVATVFAAVSHRMIPFFSASALPFLDAWRPMWLLWCMVAILWFEGAMAGVDVLLWPHGALVRWIQLALEAPAAALMLWLAIRWGLVQSLKIRLLAMLHGGFLWLGIALALQAISHALMALGQPSLGLAPLHAMTMGYLGATLFAMATRVSSGHSGRPLAADNIAWTLYWTLQTAVLLRVVSALWPAAGYPPLLAAIVAWTLACCGWAVRYGSWFGRPRLDGRPG